MAENGQISIAEHSENRVSDIRVKKNIKATVRILISQFVLDKLSAVKALLF
jgi:hypothetical protein